MTDLLEEYAQELAQRAEQKDDLGDRLHEALRGTLFSSRAYLRPADLRRLAREEADAFFEFLASPDAEQVAARGESLCRVGLGDETVLALGHALRQFGLSRVETQQAPLFQEVVERYFSALLQGYMQAQIDVVLQEQERIRAALQQTLHRYTLQIETAAQVARTTVSTLDLGELLTSTVDLICESFELDYVGIYLVDASQHQLVLRAGTGLEGRKRLAASHWLKIGGPTAVGRCVALRHHVFASEAPSPGPGLMGSLVSGALSEMALPLISRDLVVGALTVQSQRAGVFSSQDVAGFQIMADQLANAIENARLYSAVRQRADELAVAYAQLQELDRLKDQFMQNVSHELRTPLTLITGYTEMLSTGQLGELSEVQQETIGVIMRSASNLISLVSDIMAVLEVRARRSATSPLALRDLVELSLANFRLLAAEKNVAILVDWPTGDEVSLVMAEPDHMRRILDNLLSNAFKFTPEGGQVTVRVWISEDRVFLEVADTGIGIMPDMQPRIFDRFFQIDSSIRRRFGGTGLGLSLVKELVEGYGGTISVASPGNNQGSTFTVALPRSMPLLGESEVDHNRRTAHLASPAPDVSENRQS